jgi:propanol-preferring alcohol dehydrogenase
MPEGSPRPIEKAFPAVLMSKQQTITGVAVGSQKEALEVLDFAARGIVRVHYRVEKMENLTQVRFSSRTPLPPPPALDVADHSPGI